MRHLLLLGFVSLVMAMATALAWQWDHARQQRATSAEHSQIQTDIQRLEQQYLSTARALLAARDPGDPLLDSIDNGPEQWQTLGEANAREAAFQALVSQVRSHLLVAPSQDEASLQEWRRAQDQMNGALHRRAQLMARLLPTP